MRGERERERRRKEKEKGRAQVKFKNVVKVKLEQRRECNWRSSFEYHLILPTSVPASSVIVVHVEATLEQAEFSSRFHSVDVVVVAVALFGFSVDVSRTI